MAPLGEKMNIFDQIDIYSHFLPKIMRKNNFSTKLFEKRNNTKYFNKNSLGKSFYMVSFKTSNTKSYIAFTAFSSAFRFA